MALSINSRGRMRLDIVKLFWFRDDLLKVVAANIRDKLGQRCQQETAMVQYDIIMLYSE